MSIYNGDLNQKSTGLLVGFGVQYDFNDNVAIRMISEAASICITALSAASTCLASCGSEPQLCMEGGRCPAFFRLDLRAGQAMIPLSRRAFRGPMAVFIMEGLKVAILLTCLFLPVLYAAWYRVKEDKVSQGDVFHADVV